MLEDKFPDNLRQAGVVAKYELKKYLRGKKMAIFAAIMALVLALITVSPYLSGEGLPGDPVQLAYPYASAMQLLVLLIATLFASGAVVSEFEDRTALVLFTKPLRKWSIFAGKAFIACIAGFAFVLAYYAFIAAASLAAAGSVAPHLLDSLCLALAYTAGTAGVALLISSLVKKSGTAAILTFMTLLVFMLLVSGILMENSVDPWFMLDRAGACINDCLLNGDISVARESGVMLAWGLATGAAGYAVFRGREL
ncbi:MAG: ABC transporter permease [Methanomassiliicoccaceae archaeon]|nr:ABC transporter permease [Methanomassiliicoccaceae archaeon]